MTREELKEHCLKQIEMCEFWAISKGEKPSGKIYEEHKLILELLEQHPSEDCISRQAVLEYIEGSEAELGHSSENELVCQDIKELPPVQPKVIRCKDCDHEFYCCRLSNRTPDSYCSFAERRTDG